MMMIMMKPKSQRQQGRQSGSWWPSEETSRGWPPGSPGSCLKQDDDDDDEGDDNDKGQGDDDDNNSNNTDNDDDDDDDILARHGGHAEGVEEQGEPEVGEGWIVLQLILTATVDDLIQYLSSRYLLELLIFVLICAIFYAFYVSAQFVKKVLKVKLDKFWYKTHPEVSEEWVVGTTATTHNVHSFVTFIRQIFRKKIIRFGAHSFP